MDDDDDLEDENDTKVERKQYPSLKGAFGIGNLDGARVDLNQLVEVACSAQMKQEEARIRAQKIEAIESQIDKATL